jgi:hypothetical protein
VATQTRAPTSDEAASGTLTGSAGSRWTLVDDHPDTTGADSITFGTTTAQITFGFSAFSVPVGATSISVQVQYYDGEAANGANNCAGRIKVGTAYFNAATHNPSGTGWTSREDNWATNPATSAAWTVDQVNGIGANALAAFGIGSTDSNPTFRVSSVRLQVTYTPLAGITADVASLAATQATTATASVLVESGVATQAAAQETAMTITVGSGDLTADVASAAAAQVTATDASVLVAAAVASSSPAQTTAMTASTLISAAFASLVPAQVTAMSTDSGEAEQDCRCVRSGVRSGWRSGPNKM